MKFCVVISAHTSLLNGKVPCEYLYKNLWIPLIIINIFIFFGNRLISTLRRNQLEKGRMDRMYISGISGHLLKKLQR